MIEVDKKYQTRDGRPVRILATDLQGGALCTVGAIWDNGQEIIGAWTEDGRGYPYQERNPEDLMPLPAKHKGWLILHGPSECPGSPYVSTTIYTTEERAEGDKMFLADQVVPIVWED
jgi:hypothetical protein